MRPGEVSGRQPGCGVDPDGNVPTGHGAACRSRARARRAVRRPGSATATRRPSGDPGSATAPAEAYRAGTRTTRERVGADAAACRHGSQDDDLVDHLDPEATRPSCDRAATSPAIVEQNGETQVGDRAAAVAAHGRIAGAQRRQVDPTSGARHQPHRGAAATCSRRPTSEPAGIAGATSSSIAHRAPSADASP